MKKIILIPILFLGLFFSSCGDKNFNQLRSPDTSLVLDISLDNGILSYSLKKDSKDIIDKSILGMKTDKFEFFDNLIIKDKQFSSSNSDWTQVWGEQKLIKDHYNQLSIVIENSKTLLEMVVHFRLYDDGLGFRYQIEDQPELDSFNILDELTEFNFSEDSPSWWIPAYAYRRYEFLYANTLISEIDRDKFSELVENLSKEDRLGPEAVQTPFTTQRKDGITIAVHEANLTEYSSMTLKANGTKYLECGQMVLKFVRKRHSILRGEPFWLERIHLNLLCLL